MSISKLMKISFALFIMVRKCSPVRETVRAKLRLLVKRILRKYKYPPDLEQRAIDLVLQQAETLSEAWV